MQTHARFASLLTIMWVGRVILPAQITMDLHDVSDEGAPVRISGTVSLDDNPSEALRYTYRTNGSVTNLSDKPILITVIHFEAFDLHAQPLRGEYEVDRFFSPLVLESGHAEEIDQPPIQLGGPKTNGTPDPHDGNPGIERTATAKVIFVQFLDGTVWGDIDAGRAYLASRSRNLYEIEKLEHLLNEYGDEAFKDELLKADLSLEFQTVGALLHECRSASDACLVHGLRQMAEAAAQHRNEFERRGLSVTGFARE